MTLALPVNARQARELAGRWLDHLPVDPGGLPVPWINRWGAETAAAVRIGWDTHAGRPALFHDDHGPAPDFTRQNIGRQREAMIRGLCQVCGRGSLPWTRRRLVLSTVSVRPAQVDGLAEPLTAVGEPWLDPWCAAIATLLCPELIRRQHGEDLAVVDGLTQRNTRLVTSVGTLNVDQLPDLDAATPEHLATLRERARRGPSAMWVRLVLLNRPISADYASQAEAAAGGAAQVVGHATI